MLRYYLDPNTGKYKSCSIIENCEECSSEKECTKCENGYMLNKDSLICEKIKTNDNKDYSVLAKAAISLSVIAIASSIAIIIFIFLKKFIFNGRPLVNNEIIPQKSENDVDNANKRSIHNEVKINE